MTGPVPLWAKVLGGLLALQVAVVIAAAAATGALLSSSVDESRHQTRTFTARPTLELALDGFPALACPAVGASGRSPACAATADGPRRLGTAVRVVPGASGRIVVDQDVRVRAAGPALAVHYLDSAAIAGATSAVDVRLDAAGWDGRDPRLLDGENQVTIRAPAGTRVITGPPPAPRNAGNPPNAPNVPNVPNTPGGRNGVPVSVAAGQRLSGDAEAFHADADIAGEVTGNVLVVGGTATIAGTVHGSVRVWDGTAVVTGQVYGRVEVTRSRLDIGPEATVAGPVTAWQPPDQVAIQGHAGGPVEVVGGAGLRIAEGGRVDRGVTAWTPERPIEVDGSAGGDVGISGGAVEFGPKAGVGGRVLLWRGARCAGGPC